MCLAIIRDQKSTPPPAAEPAMILMVLPLYVGCVWAWLLRINSRFHAAKTIRDNPIVVVRFLITTSGFDSLSTFQGRHLRFFTNVRKLCQLEIVNHSAEHTAGYIPAFRSSMRFRRICLLLVVFACCSRRIRHESRKKASLSQSHRNRRDDCKHPFRQAPRRGGCT